MTVRFVSNFLLPLVAGGALHVGRPLGSKRGAALLRAIVKGGRGETRVTDELAIARGDLARTFLHGVANPPLDESAVRIGMVVHDLLALGHPGYSGPDARAARVRESTLGFLDDLARIGPPTTVEETVFRHTVIARVDEIRRPEHAVDFWLGRQMYIGRPVPGRVRALPGLRRVRVTTTDRRWLAEIGLPAGARPAWELVQDAAPLSEALDPLRLDPPLSWHRVLSVVRFPALCRLVAGRVVALGLATAGEALAVALVAQQATLGDAKFGAESTVSEVALAAIRFLSHCAWLNHLSGSTALPGPALGALLLTAFDLAPENPGLLFPSDVAPKSRVGLEFSRRVSGLRGRFDGSASGHLASARTLCRVAVGRQSERARQGNLSYE